MVWAEMPFEESEDGCHCGSIGILAILNDAVPQVSGSNWHTVPEMFLTPLKCKIF